MTRARLRRGIEMVKLAKRIEALKMQDDDGCEDGIASSEQDVPPDAAEAVGEALARRNYSKGIGPALVAGTGADGKREKKSLSKIARGAIFREVVLAKVREMKEEEARKRFEEEAAAGKGGK